MSFRILFVLLSVGCLIPWQLPAQQDRRPLDVARVLAARYPEHVIMSYIPALAWSASLRLAALTADERLKEKPRREMQLFISGQQRAFTEPYSLTSLAGLFAFSDAAAMDGNREAEALAREASALMVSAASDGTLRYGRGWTDDMFMATALLARVAARSPDSRYASVVGRLLTSYADKLQRPDGLFVHAVEGPHAWGRGNGFAAWGLIDALTYLPSSWPERARVLDIYRRQMSALRERQTEDGSWRQVVDEGTSYREMTVTAMAVAAMAKGIRQGWLDRATFLPIVTRGWQAVLARVGQDGTVRDVCASTGAGPTREHYLTRPVVNGADDRGGAMALVAALEVEELSRAR
jgi:unsaturated rhamnogalacturonyl hydrolase